METSQETCETSISNIIYISNIPKKVDKELLRRLLQPYGPIISLNIIYRGQFAFAFAEFDDMRDAALAVKQLNQTVYQTRKLKVEFKNKKKSQNSTNPQSNENNKVDFDKASTQERQVSTEVSLGRRQMHLQKKVSQCIQEKFNRQRSREKKHNSKRYDTQKKTNKQNRRSRQKSDWHTQTNTSKKSKRQSSSNTKTKMIELPQEDFQELAQELLFIESRLSKIYDKMDRMIYHGCKLKEIMRN